MTNEAPRVAESPVDWERRTCLVTTEKKGERIVRHGVLVAPFLVLTTRRGLRVPVAVCRPQGGESHDARVRRFGDLALLRVHEWPEELDVPALTIQQVDVRGPISGIAVAPADANDDGANELVSVSGEVDEQGAVLLLDGSAPSEGLVLTRGDGIVGWVSVDTDGERALLPASLIQEQPVLAGLLRGDAKGRQDAYKGLVREECIELLGTSNAQELRDELSDQFQVAADAKEITEELFERSTSVVLNRYFEAARRLPPDKRSIARDLFDYVVPTLNYWRRLLERSGATHEFPRDQSLSILREETAEIMAALWDGRAVPRDDEDAVVLSGHRVDHWLAARQPESAFHELRMLMAVKLLTSRQEAALISRAAAGSPEAQEVIDRRLRNRFSEADPGGVDGERAHYVRLRHYDRAFDDRLREKTGFPGLRVIYLSQDADDQEDGFLDLIDSVLHELAKPA